MGSSVFELDVQRSWAYGAAPGLKRVVRRDFACGCRVWHWPEDGHVQPEACAIHADESQAPIEFQLIEVLRDVWDKPDALQREGLNDALPRLVPLILLGAAGDAERKRRGTGVRHLGRWPDLVGTGPVWNSGHWLALGDVLRRERLNEYLNQADKPVAYMRTSIENRVEEVKRNAKETAKRRRGYLEQHWRTDRARYGTRRRGGPKKGLLPQDQCPADAADAAREIVKRCAANPPRDLVGFAACKEAPPLLQQFLDDICTTPDQKEYSRLRKAGHSMTEALRRIGKSSTHIALHQKLLGRLKKLSQ